ncbi:MAG: hypothetical protein ACRESZ_07625 [Methylococcales bacterium]
MKVRQLVSGILLVAITACFSGCTSSGKKIEQSNISQIIKGRTTEADLVQMFGSPKNRSVSSTGIVTLMWMYYAHDMNAASFIPYAGLVLGGSKTETQTLVVTLGPDGKVQDFNSSTGGSESNLGHGIR